MKTASRSGEPLATLRGVPSVDSFVGNHLDLTPDAASDRFTISGIELRDRLVKVSWADGHVSEFHHVWLRSNCFCSDCGSSQNGMRSILILDISPDVRPESVQVNESGALEIEWSSDGHASEYGPEWLRTYCYSEEERRRRRTFRPTLWKSELLANLPTVTYEEVRDDDSARLAMYELLREFGIVRLRDVGIDPNDTERIAGLIGPIHQTTENGFICDIQATEIPTFGASTRFEVHPHTDDPYLYSPPGVDLFHSIENPSGVGGESVYVDAFAVADSLRREEPQAFELLSTVPIPLVRSHPGSVDFRAYQLVVRLTSEGDLASVRYFDRGVAPLDAPADLIEPLYDALRLFGERMTSPEFQIQFLLAPGDAMFLDNARVMHGRKAFAEQASRHLRLAYLDKEEFHARMRDLGRRLGRLDYDLVLPV